MTIGISTRLEVADEQEALFLMLHHLRLAATYFELVPEVVPPDFAGETHDALAINAWFSAMEAIYNAYEQGD